MRRSRAATLDFCRQMPKVELHSHLSGSLGTNALTNLKQLHQQLFPDENIESIPEDPPQSLSEAFQRFPVLQTLTDNPQSVELAVEEVVKDFAADGVIYAELRSTPRAVEGRMTKRQYVQALAEAAQRCNEGRVKAEEDNCDGALTRQGAFGPMGIQTRILVSIDRGQSLEAAEEAVDLAIEFRQLYPGVIVGVDVSGNPTKNDITSLVPLLKRAVQDGGLKTAVHLAEVPNAVEVSKFLDAEFFVPDRIGHGVEIHPSTTGGSELLWQKLLASKIPVEVCLTSNKFATSVSDLRNHPAQHILAANHPISVCTDDKGLFGITLTDEFHTLDKLFDVGASSLVRLSRKTAQYAFCDSDLKARMDSYIEKAQSLAKQPTLDSKK